MEFRVLGLLEVYRDGMPVRLTSKEQALLAVLLLHANQVVPADRLIQGVWGEAGSDMPRNSLHVLVRRLRLKLRPCGDDRPGSEVILTRPASYLLTVGPGQLDLDRFEELASRAEKAQAADDLTMAVGCFRAALALWRGPALTGVAAGTIQQAEAPRLEERRLAVLEECIELELRLGRHARLVGELTGLVARHPLRERFHGQLMLALYRSGRQADALAVYRGLRRLLARGHGLEPGGALRRLERTILGADPVLDVLVAPSPTPAPAVSPPPPARVPPAPIPAPIPAPLPPSQLPLRIAAFTGRRHQLEELWPLGRGGDRRQAAISAIDGAAGIGKSALAIHAAHGLAERFVDGQLYVNLHGATAGLAPLNPLQALRRFLHALGVDGDDVPTEVEEASAQFRSLLRHRRMLVVLDNAASAVQVLPLLPGSPTCVTLITSRQVLATLDGVTHLHLDTLAPDEAVLLLERLIGAARVRAEPEASATVARFCGYLPLALRIAGARLAARPGWPVWALADRLRDERCRLDELQLDNLAVRASFTVSYQALRDSEDGRESTAARLFRLLGLLGGPEVDVPLAAALIGRTMPIAAAALERLVDVQLLQAVAHGRYRLHDMLRLFARERALQDEPRAECDAALTRVLGSTLPNSRSQATAAWVSSGWR